MHITKACEVKSFLDQVSCCLKEPALGQSRAERNKNMLRTIVEPMPKPRVRN
mgnify:CR=1 FL=1